MARGAKVPKPVHPAAPPNMAAVNDALAKARALVGSIKRPSSSEPVGATVAVKAKASLPIPQVAVEAQTASPATPPPLPPPTRVREKSSATPAMAKAPAVKALPPPPPKAVEAVPSKEFIPPKSSGLTPSQRTQAYLKSVKETRLAEGGTLQTPPPKRPAPSPESTPPPPSPVSQGGDNHAGWDWGNGNESSRWGDYDKNDQAFWWWDHENNAYLVTQGSESWIVKEEWNGLKRSWSWDDATSVADTVVPSPKDFDSPNEIAATLAARKPSTEEFTSPDTPTPAVEAPNTSGIRADGNENVSKSPGGCTEVSKTTPSNSTGDGEDGDGFNIDKHGNVLSPEALYMRFYRKLRSVSDQSKTSQVWMGCWDEWYNGSMTSSLSFPASANIISINCL